MLEQSVCGEAARERKCGGFGEGLPEADELSEWEVRQKKGEEEERVCFVLPLLHLL